MAKFRFTAVGPDGATINGIEEALTPGMARRSLLARDLDPVEVTEKKNILQFEITKKKVGRKQLMYFSRQMAVFLRAGIPILDALESISEEMGDKLFKRILGEMADALREGETFAGAAENHPEAFPPFYLGVLRSAEVTGNLDAVLDQLSHYLEREIDARRKISSALMYPSIIMVFAVMVIVVVTTFVLPRFESFFASFHARLPLVTRILIAIAHWFRHWGWTLGIGLAILTILTILARQTDRGRTVRDRLLLKIPVLGELVRYVILERFCRILSSMTKAGVPLLEAVTVTANATNNFVYRHGLDAARQRMLRGEGLAQPLAATGLFPSAARQMFRVGEDTGSLDDQLESAAAYFDRELDYKLARFTSLFEPAVIVLVGIVVGFVAIALISALYGIYRQVRI
jgi:type IV pilus assembly protein PilC